MTPQSLSEESKDILRSLTSVATISFRADLYPDLVAAGFVKTFRVPYTSFNRYLVTDKGIAALRRSEGEQ